MTRTAGTSDRSPILNGRKMEGLDPLMDGIMAKLNEVADHSNLRAMQIEAKKKKAEAKI